MSYALDRWLDEHVDDPTAWPPAPPGAGRTTKAETWAEVPDYPGYRVSSTGRVCNAAGHMMAVQPDGRVWVRVGSRKVAASVAAFQRLAFRRAA